MSDEVTRIDITLSGHRCCDLCFQQKSGMEDLSSWRDVQHSANRFLTVCRECKRMLAKCLLMDSMKDD